jgi:hypothetical protein
VRSSTTSHHHLHTRRNRRRALVGRPSKTSTKAWVLDCVELMGLGSFSLN